MKTAVLVGLGGACGALLRFGLGKLFQSWNPHSHFSLGTFLANLLGCILMGALFVLATRMEDGQRELFAALVLTGFLGSLTTFSTFALELCKLFQENTRLFALHLAAHLGLGLSGLLLGQWLAQRFSKS